MTVFKMMQIDIKINDETIEHYVAVNITEQKGGIYGVGMQIYLINNSYEVIHNYEDGATILASLILNAEINCAEIKVKKFDKKLFKLLDKHKDVFDRIKNK